MGLRKSEFRSAEKAQTEQADQDQIDRDDDVEKTRNDENQNTGCATIGCKCAMLTVMITPLFGWQCD
jgi:hypothetical protein